MTVWNRARSAFRELPWVALGRQFWLPLGVGLTAAGVTALLVPARWLAPGLPWVARYPKNVEFAAVTVGLLAAGATQILAHHQAARRWCLGPLAVIGLAAAPLCLDLVPLVEQWPRAIVVLALFLPLMLISDPGEARAPGAGRDVSPALAAAMVAALAAIAAVVSTRSLTIDVFHHGEVLGSALDLVRGGRPFETFIWPHGAHDSGLAALWIVVTGKIGTSPVALAAATCSALGALAAYALGRRLLGSRIGALALVAGLVVARALTPYRPAMPTDQSLIHQLGVLSLAIAGLIFLLARRRSFDLLAGASFAAAYLFRIETGLYATAAGLLVLLWRDRFLAWRSGVRFLTGAGVLLLAARGLLGWPGTAWFTYTLGDLATFHRDAVGHPIAWPLRTAATPHPGELDAYIALIVPWLLFVTLLVAQAARALASPTSRRAEATSAVLFAAGFAFLAVRTALDRADTIHALDWRALPTLLVFTVAIARLRDWRQWRHVQVGLALFAVPIAIDLGAFEPLPQRGVNWQSLIHDVAKRPNQLLEHLRPNPLSEPCSDRLFTAREARLPRNRDFIAATCDLEALLREHGVRSLLVMHSAPWYYIRFGQQPPSRYFAPARAYTPEAQIKFIADVRRHSVEALLVAKGFGALTMFDVPDAVRIPVIDDYLRARGGSAPRLETKLGELILWNEPGDCRPAASTPPPSPDFATVSAPAWRALPAALERSRALGRADRARACPSCGCLAAG